MPIRVALHHKTSYKYDRVVELSPQVVRLRPAPHCRTPIAAYSMKIEPAGHFINWQQDPYSNYLARIVFPEKVDHFSVEVDLVAEMTVINPFDFFLEPYAENFPFEYDAALKHELAAHLFADHAGPELTKYLASVDRTPRRMIDFLVALNQQLQQHIGYVIRLEPGIQPTEYTLCERSGSCRDSAWLLVQILRHLGLAARFVSGYLIQLKPDLKPIEGPEGPTGDFTDLHAWTEVYLPGAGWVGLDPTSGLFAGEGHIPLAATPQPSGAAPVTGAVEACRVEFGHEMSVSRIHEDPRVTLPYSDEEWKKIEALGHQVDGDIRKGDIRLTMGGEPTFVSIDNMEGEEWNTAALGEEKLAAAEKLLWKLKKKFAPGGLLHHGQGKWYPGEQLPRWALGCYWRKDGEPLWHDENLFAKLEQPTKYGHAEALRFLEALTSRLGLDTKYVIPAFEDEFYYRHREQQLPVNVDTKENEAADPVERARVKAVFEQGLATPKGFVLPLERKKTWRTSTWVLRAEKLYLLPGDSPVGLRLPLSSLPWISPEDAKDAALGKEADPMADLGPLAVPAPPSPEEAALSSSEHPNPDDPSPDRMPRRKESAKWVVRTALCTEARDGNLYIFMPPGDATDDYIDLIAAVENTAAHLGIQVLIEGYTPPHDPRIDNIKVTPDPGVIEVNVQPSHNWEELVHNTTTIYDEARNCRLGAEKFMLDGRHSGTGGGNHFVLGGATPADSPFLRRPHLLKSMLAYWLNHPSLSYMFSGMFIGPTSQAPRVDEARHDSIYELEIAFNQIPKAGEEACSPWLVDRIFRHLLVDVTGNTHRAEFCIDKLYSPDSSTGRLGLLELRGFEMPPHARMSLTQQLLVRALIAKFWDHPYSHDPIVWGTQLHDLFMLPHFISTDFAEVIADLNHAGYGFKSEWFAPQFEFRYPVFGRVTRDGIQMEVRQATEPWYVLGEEPAGGATARYVDSSVERVQLKVTGMTSERYEVTCNGRRVPLRRTGTQGEWVAGVRYRAWQPPSCLHPTIPVHAPLVFDLIDRWSRHSLGGCTYHVSHPGGRSFETFPVNANEAESRRNARFSVLGHTAGKLDLPPAEENPEFPLTLDLRRPVSRSPLG